MLSSGSGGQPRGARGLVQADCGLESGTSGLRFRRAPLLALLLAGCSSFPASMNPVSWWHDLQGGKIAEERPPPPGADQPYPNLASVPPKPEAPDRAALANIATALIADRTNAQHAAAAAPIADPSLPSASPAPVRPRHRAAAATAAAAGGSAGERHHGRGGCTARRRGSPSPPANPPEAVPAPAKAPVGTVQSAPLAPPAGGSGAPPAPPGPAQSSPPAPPGAAQNSPLAPSGAAAQNAPLAPPGATAQPPAVAAAPPPALPTAPPPPPRLSGAGSAASLPVAAAPSLPPAGPGAAARRARNRCHRNPGDTARAQRSQLGQRNVRERFRRADVNRDRYAEAARDAEGDRHDRGHRLRRRRVGRSGRPVGGARSWACRALGPWPRR